jgi:hypothetical protein
MTEAPEFEIYVKKVNQDLKLQLDSFTCCVCLNLAYNPIECTQCEVIVCTSCYDFNKANGMNCVTKKCIGMYKKINRHAREILSSLTINCKQCGELKYSEYYKHINNCISDNRYPKAVLNQELKHKSDRLAFLEKEFKMLNTKLVNFKRSNVTQLSKLPVEQLRETIMTYDLPLKKKNHIYNSVMQGDVKEVMKLFYVNNLPILEEISKKGNYWTALHYAMHYGQYEIICLILNKLLQDGILSLAMKLESSDGRCPLMCLLKSNFLDKNTKYELLEKLLIKFNLNLSVKVKSEVKKKGFEHLCLNHQMQQLEIN